MNTQAEPQSDSPIGTMEIDGKDEPIYAVKWIDEPDGTQSLAVKFADRYVKFTKAQVRTVAITGAERPEHPA